MHYAVLALTLLERAESAVHVCLLSKKKPHQKTLTAPFPVNGASSAPFAAF